MNIKKTHYAQSDKPTESDNNTYWSNTACGIPPEVEFEATENKKEVTCKKCLKVLTPKNN